MSATAKFVAGGLRLALGWPLLLMAWIFSATAETLRLFCLWIEEHF